MGVVCTDSDVSTRPFTLCVATKSARIPARPMLMRVSVPPRINLGGSLRNASGKPGGRRSRPMIVSVAPIKCTDDLDDGSVLELRVDCRWSWRFTWVRVRST